MKLYTIPPSPYGARAALQIALKGLNIPVETCPWPLHSDEFNQRFTLRKLPVLALDDDTSIGDSWAILEYLEALYPDTPRLRPEDPRAIAHMYLLARYTDTHLAPQGMFPLFKTQLAPGSGTPEACLPALLAELQKGERLLEELPHYRERALHLGDLALAPVILYAGELLERFGGGESIQSYPLLCDWYAWVQATPAARETLEQLLSATKAFLDGLKARA